MTNCAQPGLSAGSVPVLDVHYRSLLVPRGSPDFEKVPLGVWVETLMEKFKKGHVICTEYAMLNLDKLRLQLVR